MKLLKTTEKQFKKLDIARQIICHDYPSQFALINLGPIIGNYGLAWGSELIEPVIELSKNNHLIWVGVDQRLVTISLTNGLILLSIALHTPLLKIVIADNTVAILTELEVMLFNQNCLLKCFLGLPDLAHDISFYNSEFIIKLFDGMELTLNPDQINFNESIRQYIDSKSLIMNSQ